MAINEYMMELIEEMVNPQEIALEGTVEDASDDEDDVLFGTAEDDDEIIEFIDNGGLGYEHAIDFSDTSVEDVLNDDVFE